MSDIVKQESASVSASVLEHVLGTGDLSKLSNEQRVEYFVKTCQSLGLNPLTRPFRFLTFNGQIQLYATKDGTDQLRSLRGITLHIVDKQMDAGLYIVTARARTKDGREDEDIGAVALPMGGESRANALMRGTTKAKRRVTLSICGLGGMPDESELDGMPGAMTFDPADDPPVAKVRSATTQHDAINKAVPLKPHPKPAQAAATEPLPKVRHSVAPPPGAPDADWRACLDWLAPALHKLRTRELVEEVGDGPTCSDIIANGPEWARAELASLLAENIKRFVEAEPPPSDDELPDVEIEGQDKILAG